MNARDEGLKELICAIIEQAANDYRLLMKRHVEEIKTEHAGKFGVQEIEEFFSDEWCEWLIQDGRDFPYLSGVDFLKQVAEISA